MISRKYNRTYHLLLIIQKSEQSEHDSEHLNEPVIVNNMNPVNRVNT
mgnify:CR=1 FL=1